MQQSSSVHHTKVLVVGGSLVGLSAALFLAWRGVPTIVVEKHRGSAVHPRATGFTERTLELFRAVGIADQVPQVAPGTRLRRVRADSLAGKWHDETSWTPGEAEEHGGKTSPCTGAAMAQDRLEPILRLEATKRGADIRLGVEMMRFEQDADGVTAQMRERDGHSTYQIRADYVIAADGAESSIRRALGINRQGVGHLRTLRSVLFQCPDADVFLAHGIQQFVIAQPHFNAFLTTYGDGRWVLMFDDDMDRSEADLVDAVRAALGSHMKFNVIATGRWEMAGRIAERYSEGRIFLAGDAAHQLPPTRGGFGANTGIDDVYNLAWKLQLVASGQASQRLLDTYSDERQPIGWLRHQQTFARPDYASWTDGALIGQKLYSNAAMELGQLVRSASICGADESLPSAAHPDDWKGQPGTRAPHVWVRSNERTVSSIDLFTDRLVLISQDDRWIAAAKKASSEMPVDIKTVLVGTDVVFPSDLPFAHCFGISDDGASLVRPDGIVAWRSTRMSSNPLDSLKGAISIVAAVAAP